MPVVIGGAENGFANPIGLLSDCHRRIERFPKTLAAVADQSGGLDSSAGSARSVFPRLLHSDPASPADPEEAVAGMQAVPEPVAAEVSPAVWNTDRHRRKDSRNNTGCTRNTDNPNNRDNHNMDNPNSKDSPNTDNPSPVQSRYPAPSNGLHRSHGLRNTRPDNTHHGRRLRREPLH